MNLQVLHLFVNEVPPEKADLIDRLVSMRSAWGLIDRLVPNTQIYVSVRSAFSGGTSLTDHFGGRPG